MSDAVLVGLLTFAGTVLATAVGVWQWRRSQQREDRQEYRHDRIEALKAVWEALSDAEATQRTLIMSPQEQARPDQDLRAVNRLLLRQAPFLLDDERDWASDFMNHLVEIATAVRTAGSSADVRWFADTAARPPGESIVAQAAHRMRLVGDLLAERYAAVVRGDHE